MRKIIGSAPLTELEDLVCRFAIEHGDAEEVQTVTPQYDFEWKRGKRVEMLVGTIEHRGFATPKIVVDHDEKAMRAYLAAAVKPRSTHEHHRGRTPRVCCQVADFLGQPHPFVALCDETEAEVCMREDCETHLAHHQRDHAEAPSTAGDA